MPIDAHKTWPLIWASAGAFARSFFTLVCNLRAQQQFANNAIIRALKGEKKPFTSDAQITVSLQRAKRYGLLSAGHIQSL
jgi:hypothetical protein